MSKKLIQSFKALLKTGDYKALLSSGGRQAVKALEMERCKKNKSRGYSVSSRDVATVTPVVRAHTCVHGELCSGLCTQVSSLSVRCVVSSGQLTTDDKARILVPLVTIC